MGALPGQTGASAGAAQESGIGFLHVAESQTRADELRSLPVCAGQVNRDSSPHHPQHGAKGLQLCHQGPQPHCHWESWKVTSPDLHRYTRAGF